MKFSYQNSKVSSFMFYPSIKNLDIEEVIAMIFYRPMDIVDQKAVLLHIKLLPNYKNNNTLHINIIIS